MSLLPSPPTAWVPEVSQGTKLRIVRHEYGKRTGRELSQERFAALLNAPHFPCGASKYKAWEADRTNPRDILGLARRLNEVTGCDPAWFSGVDSWTNPPGGGNVVVPLTSRKGPDVQKAQYIYTVRAA